MSGQRRSQADRRATTRNALLESAARGLSRYGYGNLVLDQVARDAGYTRGALYHQFRDKVDLTLAVGRWIFDTWQREVGEAVQRAADPLAALLTLARGHAVFCRRDIARVAIALRVEFSGQPEHPIGHEIEAGYERLTTLCADLVEAGQRSGAIPTGTPSRVLAAAFVGALEGTVIHLAGQQPYDEELAAHAVAGVLGIDLDNIGAESESEAS